MKQQQPKYITKLRALYQSGEIPSTVGLHMLDVLHDGWCGVFTGKRCNCDPDIKLKATVPGCQN